MPTTYNSHTPALDRPYQPGEFARYAETAGHDVAPETPLETSGYSSHPELQIEAERQAVNSLAMPADAHRGNASEYVPPSQEMQDYAQRVATAAEAASLIGGVENMFSHAATDLNAAQIDARFDQIAAHERDAMAPNAEMLQYRQGDEVVEAYNAACAVVANRRSVAPEIPLG